jgi:hypothetical protein
VKWKELEPTGIYHPRHGVFVRPGTPTHPGWCTGKHYTDWLEWEAEQLEAERLAERQERFGEAPSEQPPTPQPEPVETEPEPDLWVDRWAIGWRIDDDPDMQQKPGETWGECCERQQEVLNMTATAEAFRLWMELGCPITKGSK